MKINVPKLTPRQIDIFKAWKDKSITYLTVSCGRQVGKTQVAVQLAIDTLINPLYGQSLVRIGFFLPTYKQARMVFKRTSGLIGKIKGFTFNKSELRISFSGINYLTNKPMTGFIEFWTSENDNCRGNTYEYLFVDEACFIKSEIWSEAILSTALVALSARTGKVLLTSTPKEKNWFYDYFMDTNPRYKSIRFTSYESGLHSQEVLDDIKRKTPAPIFNNEYMAEFVDGLQSLFKTNELKFASLNAVTDKLASIAGIDWGIDNDYTVLVMLNTNKEVCYVNRWRRMPWNELISEILTALRAYGNPLVYAEKNGIGNMPTDELKRQYGAVRPVNTTMQLKTDMILKMAKDLLEDGIGANKKLILPDVDYVKAEFANYGISYVNNGNPKFGNMNSSTNDDTVMATAIANYHFRSSNVSFG